MNQSEDFDPMWPVWRGEEVLADPNPNTVHVHHYFEKIILLATNSVVCAFERNATLIAISSLQLVWEFIHL